MVITILLSITWILRYYNMTQYYMQYFVVFNSIILNITYNITEYFMPNHTILLNITCILGSIPCNIPQYLLGFINITQYYMCYMSLLNNDYYQFQYSIAYYVILFQHYLILPEQLGDAGKRPSDDDHATVQCQCDSMSECSAAARAGPGVRGHRHHDSPA